jgi:hypothetical protein
LQANHQAAFSHHYQIRQGASGGLKQAKTKVVKRVRPRLPLPVAVAGSVGLGPGQACCCHPCNPSSILVALDAKHPPTLLLISRRPSLIYECVSLCFTLEASSESCSIFLPGSQFAVSVCSTFTVLVFVVTAGASIDRINSAWGLPTPLRPLLSKSSPSSHPTTYAGLTIDSPVSRSSLAGQTRTGSLIQLPSRSLLLLLAGPSVTWRPNL